MDRSPLTIMIILENACEEFAKIACSLYFQVLEHNECIL